jgi:hypothetical protein
VWHSDCAVGWPCAARPQVIVVYQSYEPHSEPIFGSWERDCLRPGQKKAGADGLAAPARRRVANPRQGDFAKPDCEMAGERPATRPHNNGNTTTKVPK